MPSSDLVRASRDRGSARRELPRHFASAAISARAQRHGDRVATPPAGRRFRYRRRQSRAHTEEGSPLVREHRTLHRGGKDAKADLPGFIQDSISNECGRDEVPKLKNVSGSLPRPKKTNDYRWRANLRGWRPPSRTESGRRPREEGFGKRIGSLWPWWWERGTRLSRTLIEMRIPPGAARPHRAGSDHRGTVRSTCRAGSAGGRTPLRRSHPARVAPVGARSFGLDAN